MSVWQKTAEDGTLPEANFCSKVRTVYSLIYLFYFALMAFHIINFVIFSLSFFFYHKRHPLIKRMKWTHCSATLLSDNNAS